MFKALFPKEEYHKLKSFKLIVIAVSNYFTQCDTSIFSNRFLSLYSFVADEVCLNLNRKQCRVFVLLALLISAKELLFALEKVSY